MTDDDFAAYLKDRFNDQQAWYSRRAGDFKGYYTQTQWAVIVGSALNPVAIALSGVGADVLPGDLTIPLILSGVVAIAAGAQNVFKYQDHWIRYRGASEGMQRMKQRFDAQLGAFAIKDVAQRRRKFIDQAERLLAAEQNAWADGFENDAPIRSPDEPAADP